MIFAFIFNTDWSLFIVLKIRLILEDSGSPWGLRNEDGERVVFVPPEDM